MTLTIFHLTDDLTAGGVSRLLEFMTTCPELNAMGRQIILPIRRGEFDAPRMDADVIVSHLAVNWANFPLLTSLRAAFPRTTLIHVEHSYSERFVALHVSKRDRFETLLRSVYALFDEVVAVSAPQAHWLARKEFVREDRLHVIEPLSCLEGFASLPDRRTTLGGRRVVGAIGRMHPQKGFDILISGFRKAKHRNCELLLFGEGPQLEELRVLAGGRHDILFKGFTRDTVAAMAACDIIAMPSRWEPYGIVAIEAMAAGRPVICSRADGLMGHIAAGAIDVGENTPQGWATAFESLDRLDLTLAGVGGRLYAATARRRFIEGWAPLLLRAAVPDARGSIAA